MSKYLRGGGIAACQAKDKESAFGKRYKLFFLKESQDGILLRKKKKPTLTHKYDVVFLQENTYNAHVILPPWASPDLPRSHTTYGRRKKIRSTRLH